MKDVSITSPEANHARIPAEGFLRLSQIVPELVPVGKSSWWLGIKQGRYPKPIKLGPKTTVWRAGDIRALIEQQGKA